ncbi:uncharacterized protein LOC128546964 isoform X2 [Mercenaria mercenaria]|uniref:uncharacterized protein LOC128546964 isoform X2 n=1 Tax=Mercenaria mercenaria TaxID=6596 RepID=UPI00234E68C6|nr:uncharacterized protein LOC128546964 isoform X2 [Mercenaria mercenaria]
MFVLTGGKGYGQGHQDSVKWTEEDTRVVKRYFHTIVLDNSENQHNKGSLPSKQTFYLIDESQCTGKGAKRVVFMAHQYLQFFGIGEKHAQIYFNNAAGRNKNNNFVILYAVLRTLIGKIS